MSAAPKLKKGNSQKIFAYWEGFTESGAAPNLAPPLIETPSFVDIVAIAFAAPAEQSTITTDFVTSSNNTKAEIISSIEQLRDKGQKVVMSINGSHTVSWESLDPKTFAESVSQLSQEWKIDGVDLDNETWGTVPGKPFAEVINAIRNKMGNDFVITYPAYQEGRDDFLKTAYDDLTYIMTMAYWQDYDEAVDMFSYYENLVGGPEKLMIGIKPGHNGMNQSTPLQAVPKLVEYEPASGCKAGIMFYSLSLDYNKFTAEDRFHWVNLVHSTLAR